MIDDNQNKTTQQENKSLPPELRNPTGKGGFGDHPEHRNPGGWNPKNTFSYQINRFKNMTVTEFLSWPEITPENTRSMAEELAWKRVFESRKTLKDFQEVANRTEGMPKQNISIEKQEEISDEKLNEIDENLTKQMVDDSPSDTKIS